MKAVIDREGCISCGFCVDTCPDVFSFADDGKAQAHAEVTVAAEDSAKEARDGCPVSVIDLKDIDSNNLT